MEHVLELMLLSRLDNSEKMDLKEWLRQNKISKYRIHDDNDRTLITFEHIEDRNTFMLEWLYN
jgi:hypothetical protein